MSQYMVHTLADPTASSPPEGCQANSSATVPEDPPRARHGRDPRHSRHKGPPEQWKLEKIFGKWWVHGDSYNGGLLVIYSWLSNDLWWGNSDLLVVICITVAGWSPKKSKSKVGGPGAQWKGYVLPFFHFPGPGSRPRSALSWQGYAVVRPRVRESENQLPKVARCSSNLRPKLKMDADWGSPCFRKPTYLGDSLEMLMGGTLVIKHDWLETSEGL